MLEVKFKINAKLIWLSVNHNSLLMYTRFETSRHYRNVNLRKVYISLFCHFLSKQINICYFEVEQDEVSGDSLET